MSGVTEEIVYVCPSCGKRYMSIVNNCTKCGTLVIRESVPINESKKRIYD